MWFSGCFVIILSLIVEVYVWWKLQAYLIFLSGRTCTIGGWLNTFLPHCIYIYIHTCIYVTLFVGVLLRRCRRCVEVRGKRGGHHVDTITSIPFNSIKSKVWFRQWVGPDTCCLTPIVFKMSMNADPNASFSLSTWILKSPSIKTLSAASTTSDRKSPNSLIKSVWCPGGLYTVAVQTSWGIYH